MSKVVKILSLGNQFEAMLLGELLDERGIPHIVKSYGDSALSDLTAKHKAIESLFDKNFWGNF